MVKYAYVVVYSYQYLLDPKVASIVSRVGMATGIYRRVVATHTRIR